MQKEKQKKIVAALLSTFDNVWYKNNKVRLRYLKLNVENNKMTDKIAYTVTRAGDGGRGAQKVEFASFSKDERDDFFKALMFPGYYNKASCIINIAIVEKQGLAKLDGIQRLILSLPQRKLPLISSRGK